MNYKHVENTQVIISELMLPSHSNVSRGNHGGYINYVGKTSMVVGIRVESENIRTEIKKYCNSSYFTMIAKDERNNSVKVPGLILDDTYRNTATTNEKKVKMNLIEMILSP